MVPVVSYFMVMVVSFWLVVPMFYFVNNHGFGKRPTR
jgi:hypothetical protein